MRPILTPRPNHQPSTINHQPPSPSPDSRSTITPAALGAVLDSAANAAQKGQAQYSTPVAWAQALALPLPGYRPVLVDLTCARGDLLAGASAPGTYHRLGCDIQASAECGMRNAESSQSSDPASASAVTPHSALRTPHSEGSALNFVHADLTQFAPLLAEVHWTADCFVLNFPWDLHWYRERLNFLATSDCSAVRLAFAAHDGRTSPDTIDSTIAGLCLALDRCSPYGEGFVIANHSTMQRLIFDPSAPHAALAAHIWLRVGLPVNPSFSYTGGEGRGEGAHPLTDVLYFARNHRQGQLLAPMDFFVARASEAQLLSDVQKHLADLATRRVSYRLGATIRTFEGGHTDDTVSLWNAAAAEWRIRQGRANSGDRQWNLWLKPDGTIGTWLTPFQEHQPVLKQSYARLHSLKGKRPMQLVLQVASRKELQAATSGETWRVQPALAQAVQDALAEYAAARTPLYPLNPTQRLGYLDEQETLLCTQDLPSAECGMRNAESSRTSNPASASAVTPHSALRTPHFKAGQRYALTSKTVQVKRSGQKLNLAGEQDDVLWEGSELALYLKGEDGKRHLFMDASLRSPDVSLSIQREGQPSPIEFTLEELLTHVEVPAVPDVAERQPERFEQFRQALHQIEALCAAGSEQ